MQVKLTHVVPLIPALDRHADDLCTLGVGHHWQYLTKVTTEENNFATERLLVAGQVAQCTYDRRSRDGACWPLSSHPRQSDGRAATVQPNAIAC